MRRRVEGDGRGGREEGEEEEGRKQTELKEEEVGGNTCQDLRVLQIQVQLLWR